MCLFWKTANLLLKIRMKPLCTQNGISHIHCGITTNSEITCFVMHPFTIPALLNPLANLSTAAFVSAAIYFSRQLQKSHPEWQYSEGVKMYTDSPETAAYDEAGQPEAGSLKAWLMCNKTERWQSFHRVECFEFRDSTWDSKLLISLIEWNQILFLSICVGAWFSKF